MAFTPESLKKQNELIRALQRRLADTERELADQKWIHERFLESPSWKLTSPLRGLARWSRSIRGGSSNDDSRNGAAIEQPPSGERIAPGEPRQTTDLKKAFTAFQRSFLESFLGSEALLELPSSDEPEISIVLVLFNRADLTFACLRSIAEAHSEKFEVIIVDNASSDETPLVLNRLRGAQIIRNSENENFLAGVNQACKLARGKFILLLNSDAQLFPGTLRAALDTMRNGPDIGAVGGKIILLDGTLQEAGSVVWRDGSCLGYGRGDTPFAPTYMFRRDVDYCSGAFLMTPLALWRQFGGFDESFRPAYYEETDYCMRLWQRGYRVVFEPEAVVLHYEFGSSPSPIAAIGLQSAHQRVFAARHRSELDNHEPADMNRLVHARMRHSGRRVLFLDDRAPHEWLGSGFPRTRAILRALLKQRCFVTLYPLSVLESVLEEDWATIYSDIPREVEVMTAAGPEMFEMFFEGRRSYYDTIIVSRPHNMKVLQAVLLSHPEWFETTRIIYDAEAVFTYRREGLRKLSGDPMPEGELQDALRSEISLAASAHHVISVSTAEAETFKSHGIPNVSILGHALKAAPTAAAFEERAGFLFVGSIHKEASPNADSLVWFLSEVFPRIQKTLGAEVTLTIAGVNQSERVREEVARAGPSVRIVGQVPDLTPLYSAARVFVAPTRFAAGIPHKVHEAAARGLPVVMTPLLAAQLEWTERELAIGDSAEAFAEAAIDVYTHCARWEDLRRLALERVTRECSEEAFECKVGEILAANDGPDPSKPTRLANAGMDR